MQELEICKKCKIHCCSKYKLEAFKSGSCIMYDPDYDGFGPSMAGLNDWE